MCPVLVTLVIVLLLHVTFAATTFFRFFKELIGTDVSLAEPLISVSVVKVKGNHYDPLTICLTI